MTLYLGGKAVSVNSMVTTEKEKTKLGLTIDNFIGDLDENGVLIDPKPIGDTLDFSGVVEWKASMRGAFFCKSYKHILFPDLKYFTQGRLEYAFANNTEIEELSFPALEKVTGSYAFENMLGNCYKLKTLIFPELLEVHGGRHFASICTNNHALHTVSMPKLKSMGPYNSASGQFQGAFGNCMALINVDLTSLELIEGFYACQGMFSGCSKLETILLPSLKTIGHLSSSGGECLSMLSNCSSLSTVDLSGLESILGKTTCQQMFNSCRALTTISFPKLTRIEGTTPMVNMFSGCTNLLEIHFRADMQTTVEALSEYSNKFGATNATIYFDL